MHSLLLFCQTITLLAHTILEDQHTILLCRKSARRIRNPEQHQHAHAKHNHTDNARTLPKDIFSLPILPFAYSCRIADLLPIKHIRVVPQLIAPRRRCILVYTKLSHWHNTVYFLLSIQDALTDRESTQHHTAHNWIYIKIFIGRKVPIIKTSKPAHTYMPSTLEDTHIQNTRHTATKQKTILRNTQNKRHNQTQSLLNSKD